MKSENNLEELDMGFNEWKYTKLGEVIDVLGGYAFKSKDFTEQGIPVIKIKNIVPPIIDISDVQYVSEEMFILQEKYSLNYNDILISLTGSNINQLASVVGKVGRVRQKNGRMLLNQRVGKLIVKDANKIDQEFLYYLISQKSVQYELALSSSGSANQANISPKNIKDLEFALPPLNEQKAIADILSSLDDKIELNNQMNATLEEMAQALFKRWFVDFEFPNEEGKPYKSSGGEMVESELGMIPKGWDIWSLGNIINLLMGLSPKSDTYNIIGDGAPLLNGAADFNGADIEPTKYTTDPKRICKSGDILFCIRGTIGNVTFADREYCLGRGVAAISPRNNYDLGLVYQTVNRKIEQLKLNAKGSVIVGISKDDINNVKLVLGNKDVRIKYNNLFESIYGRVKLNNEQNTELKNIRDSLLPKLMSGEIRVSDLKS